MNTTEYHNRASPRYLKYFKIFFSLVFGLTLIGCASSPQSGRQNVSLDEAIKIAAENIASYMNRTSLPDSATLAITNFKSASHELSAYVIDELSLILAGNNRFIVVDRQRLDIIRNEERFRLAGEVSDESMQSIGKKLGAQYVIAGELLDMGDSYRFRVRALVVETAVVTSPTAVNVYHNDSQIDFFMDKVISQQEMKKKETAQTARRAKNEAAQAAWEKYSENAYRSSIEYGVNHYVEWNENENYTGLYWEPVSVHWTFLPFTSVGLGAGFGFGKTADGRDLFKGGVTPYAGLVIPVNDNVRFFGDALMEAGYSDMGSFFSGTKIALNPGFDTGVLLSFKNGIGFNIRYKGIWTGDDNYVHSFGLTLSEDARKANGSVKLVESRTVRTGQIIFGALFGASVTGLVYSIPKYRNYDDTGPFLGTTFSTVGGICSLIPFIVFTALGDY